MAKRILIVEDDDDIASIERDYLEVGGYEVTVEENGTAGLAEALTGDYDLILLDIMLPGMDGFQIVRKLRDKVDIPIMMVTARRSDIDKIRGLGFGADDYIEKPFSPGVLVSRVKAHLAQYGRLSGKRQNRAEITAGSIKINTETRRVYVREREIELKNKEYEMLLFLVLNEEIVFSKEKLYEKIWGMEAIGDNATVAVHINRLREKIEDDPAAPRYIQTVWGAGYRFSHTAADGR